jgi:hypothetical protein
MNHDKLNLIKKLVSELDMELMEYVDSSPDMIEACTLLAELNFLKRDLATAYDSLSFAMGRIMGNEQEVNLENGVQIEKTSSYERKGWKHKELGSAVADKLIRMSIDMDTGEVIKSPQDIALDMLTYCAPSYWRVKELNKIGINPDNYCDVGDLKTSIIVRKPKQ